MSVGKMDVASTDRRIRMVAAQLVSRGICDEHVLRAMLEVPREQFVLPSERATAYEDSARPVACGQTISQPYIVARMLELLKLTPESVVLEVGTGTGYQAALLGKLCCKVVTIERHRALGAEARKNLRMIGIENVEVRIGDGTTGALDLAPYDAIVVAAAAPQLPDSLLSQLACGGRMVCPVGSTCSQRLVLVMRSNDGHRDEFEDLEPVVFVPLIGVEGWQVNEIR